MRPAHILVHQQPACRTRQEQAMQVYRRQTLTELRTVMLAVRT